MKIQVNFDLSGFELLNARLQNLATAPSSPTTGRFYWDTNLSFLRVYDGAQWDDLASRAWVTTQMASAGSGDMLKASYDTNDNGIVDRAAVADEVDWSDVQNAPATFPATSHTHAISQITNLQTTLNGKANTSHSHTIANVTGLQAAIDGKAATTHAHAISDTTGLQTALDGKAASTHTHTASDISDFNTSVNTQVAAYWDTIAGGDNNADTIRETLDIILANASAVQDQVKRFDDLVGDGSATSIAVTHSLNTTKVIVQVYEVATDQLVLCDVTRTNANVVTLGFGAAPSTDEFEVVIIA